MTIIHWIGIDDHADKWTIAQFRGDEEKPAKGLEMRQPSPVAAVVAAAASKKLADFMRLSRAYSRVGAHAFPSS